MPEPLLAWSVGYTGFLLWMTFGGLAAMRFVKERHPSISNVKLSVISILGAMVVDMVVESLLIRFSGLYAYPGLIRSLSLWGGCYLFPLI